MSTTEERYARAINSSHLEVKEETRGDADTLIAAGMAETLGVMLARLRAEWDAQSGEAQQYARAAKSFNAQADGHATNARMLRQQAASVRVELSKPIVFGESRADPALLEYAAKKSEAEGQRLRREAERELITGRAMVLMNLRSLRQIKQAILNFAVKQAERRGIDPKDHALIDVCGKVLDVWLDRKCHHCEGRGFNGGYREPQVHCRPCRGSGNRRQGTLHEVEAFHQYGLWILNVMDTKSTGAMGQINRKTRSNA